MNHKLFQIGSFVKYWLHAVDAHSLHSPFFYEFYTKVVLPQSTGNARGRNSQEQSVGSDSSRLASNDERPFDRIEAIRASLLDNHQTLNINDLGAGSKHHRGPERSIADIARHSLSSEKYSKLYHRAITHFGARHVLELGTSLGINTMYLAVQPDVQVTTMEGSEEIAALASSLFVRQQINNITVVKGNIDEQLAHVVKRMPQIDFAFVDANHRYDPTCAYFETLLSRTHNQTIIVLDDIHESPGMNAAWRKVIRHPRVTGTADLFRCGFIFFDPSLNSQHFVLQT